MQAQHQLKCAELEEALAAKDSELVAACETLTQQQQDVVAKHEAALAELTSAHTAALQQAATDHTTELQVRATQPQLCPQKT